MIRFASVRLRNGQKYRAVAGMKSVRARRGDGRMQASLPFLFRRSVVKEISRINEKELLSGSGKSWHDAYKNSAYIFIGAALPERGVGRARPAHGNGAGNVDFTLTEGDLLAVFSQYAAAAPGRRHWARRFTAAAAAAWLSLPT